MIDSFNIIIKTINPISKIYNFMDKSIGISTSIKSIDLNKLKNIKLIQINKIAKVGKQIKL